MSKPPADWNPCQQVGNEHHWSNRIIYLEKTYAEDGRLAEEAPHYICKRCGVTVRELDEYV